MHQTHGLGSRDLWGQPRRTSERWDGRKAQWSESTLLLKANVGDVWKLDPAYGMGFVRQMLEEARIQILWTQAAMHRHGAGAGFNHHH
eukprot:3761919-Karenia_brevis.AAC.1